MDVLQNGESEIILRVFLALILGLILGLQRESMKLREKNYGVAGMRTHTIVALGASLISAIGTLAFSGDPARLAASILTGIGFIGAGTVIASAGKIKGLVNAATIWLAASIGIAAGLGFFLSAFLTTILSIFVLELKRFEKID